MAGLFRAPKPVVVPPQPAPAPTAAEPASVSAQAAEAARVENRATARQGIGGTIATSARGVLAPLPIALTRKSLLGE
ncbi:MAG: hypothetical protein WCP77_03225 [Roseococcus sp.]